MKKPTVSLFELGYGLNMVAGLESAEEITSPVESAHMKVSGLFDSSSSLDLVKGAVRDLDRSADSLDTDARANVKREQFLASYGTWLLGWKQFYANHETSFQIMLAGRDATMTQVKEWARQLDEWRKAYVRETNGQAPSGVMPVFPQDEGKSFFQTSATTKVLLIGGAVLVLGALGYATYRYVRKMKSDVDRAEEFARGLAERAVRRTTGGSFSAGQEHATLGAGE